MVQVDCLDTIFEFSQLLNRGWVQGFSPNYLLFLLVESKVITIFDRNYSSKFYQSIFDYPLLLFRELIKGPKLILF